MATACSIAQLPKSSYYYQSTGIRKGKLPSSHTPTRIGKSITNDHVVEQIKELLTQPFIDYGYQRVTHALRNSGLIINPKKVYRLMKEHQLLYPTGRVNPMERKFVRFTVPRVSKPFEVVEIDIKYVYLHQERRNAYLLTLFDVATRHAPVWKLQYSMTAKDVAMALYELKDHPLVKAAFQGAEIIIMIRTDNGPQFLAKLTIQAIKDLLFEKENIRKATPQQNGHIESFHSTVERLVIQQYELNTLEEAITVFEQFYHTYNNKRIMKSILYQAPSNILSMWIDGKVEIKWVDYENKFFFREGASPDGDCPLSSEVFGQRRNYA